MSDPHDTTANDRDLTQFREWLEHTATREGTTSDEVLDRLVSTYWILQELQEELDDDVDLEAIGGRPSDTSEAGSTEVVEAIKAMAEVQAHPEANSPERSGSIDRDLIELIEALNRGTPERTTVGTETGPLERGLARTEDRVDRIRDDLSDVRSDLRELSRSVESMAGDEAVEDLADRHRHLEGRVETVFAELQAVLDDHRAAIDAQEASLADIDTRTDDLAADLDHEIEQREVAIEALIDEITSISKTATSTKSLLHDLEEEVADRSMQVDAEFDDITADFQEAIEGIEDHISELYGASDENDARISQIVTVLDTRLQAVLDDRKKAGHLASIKEQAGEFDISSAPCASCGNDVDISMLSRPECPNCNRVFGNVESKKKWMFLNDYELTTLRPGHEFETKSVESDLADWSLESAEEEAPPEENETNEENETVDAQAPAMPPLERDSE